MADNNQNQNPGGGQQDFGRQDQQGQQGVDRQQNQQNRQQNGDNAASTEDDADAGIPDTDNTDG